MSFEVVYGDIFAQDVPVIVNPVNCVGVMGKGLALQFKARYPTMYTWYRQECLAGRVKVGHVQIVQLALSSKVSYIVNFPTKIHWREPSRLVWIATGLDSLVAWCRASAIAAIAVPALGCQNGGLRLADVQPLIEAAAAQLPTTRVLLVLQPKESAESADG